MSDGSSKPSIGEMLSQHVVKPIADELGKMVEVGAQSVSGSGQPQDPEEAQKKAEEAKKIQNVKTFLAQMQADEQRLRQQRAQEQQVKAQETQEEKQTEENKKVEKNQKKQENQVVEDKQRAIESRQGKGMGG